LTASFNNAKATAVLIHASAMFGVNAATVFVYELNFDFHSTISVEQ